MIRLSDSLLGLQAVGTVAELRARADKGLAGPRPKVNAHIHLPPNFSAFTTVAQVIDLAADQGIGVLGVSNYYDYTVYGEFAALASARGIYPLLGLEIICMHEDLQAAAIKVNDPVNPGKMYVCGKGITKLVPMSEAATRVLGRFRTTDVARIQTMVHRMAQTFAQRGLATGLDVPAVINMVVRRHGVDPKTVCLQERHVAQAFQEAIFAQVPAAERLARLPALLAAPTSAKSPDDAVAVQNDLRSHLMKVGKPAYVAEDFVSFAAAFELIAALGGITCYPVLADGTGAKIAEFEQSVDQLAAKLQARNIHAAEFIPNRNAPEVVSRYTKALRAAGLIVTAGTEHNTLDLIPLEPACKGGVPLPEDLKAIYWEGACVIAAHQFLTLHGEIGYVDANGQLNPAYPDAEARIRSLAKLGAAVIGKYECQRADSNNIRKRN
jgi:hypothetical protein